MQNRFSQTIKKHALIVDGKRTLLAISGGVDSMVLWHLIHDLKIDYAVAHCNFQLRDIESDQDEAFVKAQAKAKGIVCHTKSFETTAYAAKHKVSTQMAARDLRYAWFGELQKEHNYSRLFLAHHLNDNVETVLLNLVRGTSIRGLTGMELMNSQLIRPMLNFSKDEILAFAASKGIAWREDQSNSETYYKRNFVRKEIVPGLTTLNPDFLVTMKRNMAKNEEVKRLTEDVIHELRNNILISSGEGQYTIQKSELTSRNVGPYVLSEVLQGFGFNYFQSEEIISSIDGISGKSFKSESHELLIDRKSIHIRDSAHKSQGEVFVNLGDDLHTRTFEYKADILEASVVVIDKSQFNAMFDLDKLSFPLTMRKWNEGDKFQPLGMKGQKLISDLLVDLKVSRFDKDDVQVLCSANEVVWVVGYRISDKFRVDAESTSIIYYRLKD